MTGKGHTYVGIVSTIGMFHFCREELSQSLILSILGAIFLVIGSTAPDYLEIRKSNGGTVIKHRTITHWLPIWLSLFFFSFAFLKPELFGFIDVEYLKNEYLNNSVLWDYLFISIFGFACGGLLHLLTDLPNPMGIPILFPSLRFSLKLWKSGKYETQITIVFLILNLIYVDLISINAEKITSYIS